MVYGQLGHACTPSYTLVSGHISNSRLKKDAGGGEENEDIRTIASAHAFFCIILHTITTMHAKLNLTS